MDLRIYYQKIRDAQATISDPHPVIVSRETPDGGKEGTLTEVPSAIAAKMVVEGAARLATAEETQITGGPGQRPNGSQTRPRPRGRCKSR